MSNVCEKNSGSPRAATRRRPMSVAARTTAPIWANVLAQDWGGMVRSFGADARRDNSDETKYAMSVIKTVKPTTGISDQPIPKKGAAMADMAIMVTLIAGETATRANPRALLAHATAAPGTKIIATAKRSCGTIFNQGTSILLGR